MTAAGQHSQDRDHGIPGLETGDPEPTKSSLWQPRGSESTRGVMRSGMEIKGLLQADHFRRGTSSLPSITPKNRWNITPQQGPAEREQTSSGSCRHQWGPRGHPINPAPFPSPPQISKPSSHMPSWWGPGWINGAWTKLSISLSQSSKDRVIKEDIWIAALDSRQSFPDWTKVYLFLAGEIDHISYLKQ